MGVQYPLKGLHFYRLGGKTFPSKNDNLENSK